MDKKRTAQGPPQQASPGPTGVTVAAYAQRDSKRADREREKANQRKAAVQVVLSATVIYWSNQCVAHLCQSISVYVNDTCLDLDMLFAK